LAAQDSRVFPAAPKPRLPKTLIAEVIISKLAISTQNSDYVLNAMGYVSQGRVSPGGNVKIVASIASLTDPMNKDRWQAVCLDSRGAARMPSPKFAVWITAYSRCSAPATIRKAAARLRTRNWVGQVDGLCYFTLRIAIW